MYGRKVKLRFLFVVLILITLILTAFLVLKSLEENVVYFQSPSEIKALSELDKKKIRVFDHISIFYLIAGSYAPVCLITLYDSSGIKIFTYVIILALLGTLMKIFFTGKFDKTFLLFYLCMGWLIILDFDSVVSLIPLNGILLLVLSGLLYSVGTIFYSLQNMKYSHAIWHLFVLGGSASHYFVVLFYVI